MATLVAMTPLLQLMERMPCFPDDNAELVLGGSGYDDRADLVRETSGIMSAFEFGGHFGFGLITWLETFPWISTVGWCDDESMWPGSNDALLRNLRIWQRIRGRQVYKRQYTSAVEVAAVRGKYDLVMVDGEHTPAGAFVDLTLALTMRPTLILVDDMQLDPVREAVERFSAYTGLPYETHKAAAGTAIFREVF